MCELSNALTISCVSICIHITTLVALLWLSRQIRLPNFYAKSHLFHFLILSSHWVLKCVLKSMACPSKISLHHLHLHESLTNPSTGFCSIMLAKWKSLLRRTWIRKHNLPGWVWGPLRRCFLWKFYRKWEHKGEVCLWVFGGSLQHTQKVSCQKSDPCWIWKTSRGDLVQEWEYGLPSTASGTDLLQHSHLRQNCQRRERYARRPDIRHWRHHGTLCRVLNSQFGWSFVLLCEVSDFFFVKEE